MSAGRRMCVSRSGTGGEAFRLGSVPPLSDLQLQSQPPGKRKIVMKKQIPFTSSIAPIRNSHNPSRDRADLVLIPLVLAFVSVVLSVAAQAQTAGCRRDQDGGYANQNSAENEDALNSN